MIRNAIVGIGIAAGVVVGSAGIAEAQPEWYPTYDDCVRAHPQERSGCTSVDYNNPEGPQNFYPPTHTAG